MGERNPDLSAAQRQHWQSTYHAHPSMYGRNPSKPATHASEVFRHSNAHTVLELGAGHGRDAVFFATEGFTVHATDFSPTGLIQLQQIAREHELADRVSTVEHDVHNPLPLPDCSMDAVFAHMLLCMALSTQVLFGLVAEVHRVLRPGGAFIYTVRHTGDAHYGMGIAHGDDIYEHGGFAVHFFSRPLVQALAEGWQLREIHEFDEGDLPRKLWRITQTRPTDAP